MEDFVRWTIRMDAFRKLAKIAQFGFEMFLKIAKN